LKGEIIRKPYAQMYPISLDNYDMFHWCMSGGPGYGDPLEREINLIEEDLNDGIYTVDKVYNIYGAVAKYEKEKNEWIIDKNATQERRKEIINERKEKSITFEEFWQQERKKIIENQLSKPVKRMFKESLELSNKWAKIFKEFWNLADNFKMEVD